MNLVKKNAKMEAERNEMLHKLEKLCKERANYEIEKDCKGIEKQSNERLAFHTIMKSMKSTNTIDNKK